MHICLILFQLHLQTTHILLSLEVHKRSCENCAPRNSHRVKLIAVLAKVRGYSQALTLTLTLTFAIIYFGYSHGRPHMGQIGSADPPPGKMDENLKIENMQKRAVFYVFVIF